MKGNFYPITEEMHPKVQVILFGSGLIELKPSSQWHTKWGEHN
uniref:Uncharacterized protein n=1 Tax=Arundo donax TaxID=35708 RepID=A0A0A9CBX4_ARUDO